MALQTLTLHLPDSIYQRLVDLAQKSDRPLEEASVNLLNSALMADVELVADISDTRSAQEPNVSINYPYSQMKSYGVRPHLKRLRVTMI